MQRIEKIERREMDKTKPRILMLSHRNIVNKILARCLWFEFEDIIREIDKVEMLAPGRLRHFDRGYRRAARVGRRFPIALNPGVAGLSVDGEYDLFFTVCAFPTDLLYVNALKKWREKCKTAVCWIDEIFLNDMKYVKYFRKIISQFDHVIVSCNQVVGEIQKFIHGECVFLVTGVDAILFCPYPNPPGRFIDVLSIGRRSEEIHNQLIKAAEENRICYFYDTISYYGCKYGLTASDTRQHRLLLSNLAKRSKYFLVNPGKYDDPEATGGEEVIGARYFEGAASGTVMIGGKPGSEEFSRSFFWPDAVIDLPSSSDEIEKVINDISIRSQWENKIRQTNIVNSLLYHDWVYRWETVLKVAGLEPMPELLERKTRLENLARIAENETNHNS
jgi:hypothetical protein